MRFTIFLQHILLFIGTALDSSRNKLSMTHLGQHCKTISACHRNCNYGNLYLYIYIYDPKWQLWNVEIKWNKQFFDVLRTPGSNPWGWRQAAPATPRLTSKNVRIVHSVCCGFTLSHMTYFQKRPCRHSTLKPSLKRTKKMWHDTWPTHGVSPTLWVPSGGKRCIMFRHSRRGCGCVCAWTGWGWGIETCNYVPGKSAQMSMPLKYCSFLDWPLVKFFACIIVAVSFCRGVKNSPSCLVQLRHGMLTEAWSLSTRKNHEQRFAICAFWKVAEISLMKLGHISGVSSPAKVSLSKEIFVSMNFMTSWVCVRECARARAWVSVCVYVCVSGGNKRCPCQCRP